jgi:Uma2 family endonuclease
MSAVADARYSAADLLKHPDRDRFELVNGELVEKDLGWASSRIAVRLASFLFMHCDPHQLGWVNGPDAGYQCYEEVYPDDPDRVRKPDVSFIRQERLSPDDRPEGHCDSVPDLVAEVISPNDTAYEVRKNTEEYLRAGVQLVWVIDPLAKQVDVHRDDGSVQ